MTLKPIQVCITGVDKVTPVLNHISHKTEGFMHSMEKLSIAGGIGGALMGAGIGSELFKFQESMARIQGFSGLGGEQVQAFGQKMLDMGLNSMHGATEIGEAAAKISELGMNLKALKDVITLSADGFMDVSEAATAADEILDGYNKDASELGKVNDMIAVSARRGGMGFATMTHSLQALVPTAQALNIPFEDIVSVVGMIGKSGMNVNRATRSISTALVSLQAPSEIAIKTLNRLKIHRDAVLNSDKSLKSMSALFGELQRSGATSADMVNIFGRQAGIVMAKLIADGSESLKGFKKALDDSEGAAEKMEKTIEETPWGKLKKNMAELQTAGIDLGNALTPVLLPLSKDLSSLAKSFSELDPEMKKVTTGITALVMASGPLLNFSKKIKGVLGKLGISDGAAAGSGLAKAALPVTAAYVALRGGVGKPGESPWERFDAVMRGLSFGLITPEKWRNNADYEKERSGEILSENTSYKHGTHLFAPSDVIKFNKDYIGSPDDADVMFDYREKEKDPRYDWSTYSVSEVLKDLKEEKKSKNEVTVKVQFSGAPKGTRITQTAVSGNVNLNTDLGPMVP